MKILQTVTGSLPVNTYYIVVDDNAILIDGGVDGKKVLDFAQKNNFTVKYMLLTHTHFDHATCAKTLQDNGVKIYVNALEEHGLQNDDINLSKAVKVDFPHLYADATFNDGDVLDLLGIKIKCIHTPGHTKGSSCFLVDNDLFSGDTLFCECVGRIDLPTANGKEMILSLKKLMQLDDSIIVHPGHGEQTSIKHERIYNPYL